MARYDIFPGENGVLLIDVRADRLEALANYVLIPLLPTSKAPHPVYGLNPTIALDGEDYVLMTQLIAAAPRKLFGKPIGSASDHHDTISRALDVLLTGF